MSPSPANVTNNQALQEFREKQITEFIDKNTWDQISFPTKKVADNVILSFVRKGKANFISEGPLFLLDSTYYYQEIDYKGRTTNIGDFQTVEELENLMRAELDNKHGPKANVKVDTYAQKQEGSNKIIVFEFLTPLHTDITGSCSEKKKINAKVRNFPPILMALMAYLCLWIGFAYAPQFGIIIDYLNPVFVAFNVFFITAIGFLMKIELIETVYVMLVVVVHTTPVTYSFSITQEQYGNQLGKKQTISRIFDAHYIRVFYSDKVQTEALDMDEEQIETERVKMLQEQYAKAKFELNAEKKKNKDLENKIGIFSRQMDAWKRSTDEIGEKMFIDGYNLRHQEKFPFSNSNASQSGWGPLVNSQFLEKIIYIILIGLIFIILVQFGIPGIFEAIQLLLETEYNPSNWAKAIMLMSGIIIGLFLLILLTSMLFKR